MKLRKMTKGPERKGRKKRKKSRATKGLGRKGGQEER
jgi:hypothetical protein